MAKSSVNDSANIEQIDSIKLTAAQRQQIKALKPDVSAAARSFGAVREKMSTLAPKLMKLFTGIQTEHPTFQFVQFARMFDASIPTNRNNHADGTAGYLAHPTYNALVYMKRLVQAAGTQRQAGGNGQRQGGARDTAVNGLARAIATILQIVDDPAALWAAMATEYGWGERVITRMRKRVEETKPLVILKAQKPAHVGAVIHLAPAAATENTEPLAQPGRRVAMPEAQPAATARRRSA